jgi:hypothetical protein
MRLVAQFVVQSRHVSHYKERSSLRQ